MKKKVGMGVKILNISSFILHYHILSPLQPSNPPPVVSSKLLKRKAGEKVRGGGVVGEESVVGGGLSKNNCSIKNKN